MDIKKSIILATILLSLHNVGNADDNVVDKNKSEEVKVTGSISFDPAFTWEVYAEEREKNGLFSQKLSLKLGLEKEAFFCDKNKAKFVIEGKCKDLKSVTLSNAYVELARHVVIGYTTSNIFYPNSNFDLPITALSKVVQLKWQDEINCFNYGIALEKAEDMPIGRIEKTNQLASPKKITSEDAKKKNNPLQPRNVFPDLGIHVGVGNERYDISLRGVGRWVDYYMPKGTNKKVDGQFTAVANLGIQYKIIPKKTTVTVQGIYSLGMGDYISGLSSLEDTILNKEKNENEEVKQATTLYYIEDNKDKLIVIDGWGIGGTFEHYWSDKLSNSLAGSYLTILEKI